MKITFLVLLALFISPLQAKEKYSFENVEYLSCYDGDTCRFNIPGIHPLIGKNIAVRLRNIDTPEIKGKCEAEKRKARQARDFLRQTLKGAKRIDLVQVGKGKYFRLVGIVVADGVDTSNLLIKKGLAVRYSGGKKFKKWCP